MARIMIVDNDKQAANLLSRFMLMEGYESVLVNDSAQVVQMAGSTKPDLFLVDLMMPGLDGFELCKVLRADPDLHHLPIIIVSAEDAHSSKASARKAGANEFVLKPIQPDELMEKIKALLKKTYK